MGSAEPRVIGEPSLLWRLGVGAVDLSEVLREHHAALQFFGAGVGAEAEVDDGALLPPAVPGFDHGPQLLVVDEGRHPVGETDRRTAGGGVFGLKGENVGGGGEPEVVGCLLAERGLALPAEGEVVSSAVEGVLDDGRLAVAADDARLVALGTCEVGGGIGMTACGVGQTDAHLGTAVLQQFRLDAIECSILVLQGGGGDLEGMAVDHKLRLDDAVVEFQFLADGAQVAEGDGLAVGRLHVKADDAQVQAVGVYTEILGGLLVAAILSLLVFYGVDLRVAVTQVECLLAFPGREAVGVFELMPSPVGHGSQRHTCLIVKRERLQSGDVDRRCEVAVAHAERCQWVGLGDDGVVALCDGLSVDGLHDVVGGESHLLHFERCPDEGAEALGIVVANLLGEIVVVRAVAATVLLD